MAYHHFYLTHDMIGESDGIPSNINVITNDLRHKIFEIEFDDLKFTYEYDFGWFDNSRTPLPKVHTITPRFSGDALETMLIRVLHKDVDFE